MCKDKRGETGRSRMDATKRSSPLQSLKQSLSEMNAMRQGKLQKRSWKDFKNELKENK